MLLDVQRNSTVVAEKKQDDTPKGNDMILIRAPQLLIDEGKSLSHIFGHLLLRLDSLVFAFFKVNSGMFIKTLSNKNSSLNTVPSI